MAKGLVGGGANGIATLLASAARSCACQSPELATLVELGEGLGLQPDSWTAAAFRPGDYDVAQPLAAGLEVWKYLPYPQPPEIRRLFRPLAAGDRVVVLWIGPRPVIICRLGDDHGDRDVGEPVMWSEPTRA